MPLLLFGYDVLRHRPLHCNRHCETVLGYSARELLAQGQQRSANLLHPDSRVQEVIGSAEDVTRHHTAESTSHTILLSPCLLQPPSTI